MATAERAPVIKILLIGPSSSGKTSRMSPNSSVHKVFNTMLPSAKNANSWSAVLKRYVDDIFDPDDTSTTIGVDFREKRLSINSKPHRLLLHDTAGQERFRTLTSSYYRNAHGVLMVYDISNRDSFLSMPRWDEEVATYAPEGTVKILVGNKLDRAGRSVSVEEGEEMAKKLGCRGFLECSAKTKTGVQEPFLRLVKEIVETPGLVDGGERRRAPGPGRVDVSKVVETGTGGYCAC